MTPSAAGVGRAIRRAPRILGLQEAILVGVAIVDPVELIAAAEWYLNGPELRKRGVVGARV
jgi:hypothetical protein